MSKIGSSNDKNRYVFGDPESGVSKIITKNNGPFTQNDYRITFNRMSIVNKVTSNDIFVGFNKINNAPKKEFA